MDFKITRRGGLTGLLGTLALAGLLGTAAPVLAQDTITVVNSGDAQPQNILPGRDGNASWAGNVFEPVFDINVATGEPIPVLAKDWSVSDDGLTMKITLRDDVTYHTDRKFTADDVKYTIDLARDPKTASQVGFIAKAIEAIDVTGEHDLTLHFAHPVANIFEFFARTLIVDRETYDQRVDGSKVIGTGPYRFVEWQPGATVTLERYDGYRDPEAAKIPHVEIAIINDPTAEISALRSQRAQIAVKMQPRDVIEFSNSPMFRTEVMGGSQYPLGVDVTKPPFDNKLVRQAIGYAIDRERINQQVFDSMGTPTDLLWLPGSPGYTEEAANHYNYDPDKAKALLAEAGVTNPEITIALHALPSQRAIFEIVQNNLTEVGFKVNAEIIDTAAFGERQAAADLNSGFLLLQAMVGLSPATLISSAPGLRETNPSHFWSDEYAKLRTAVEQAKTKDETAAAVEALSTYLNDEAFSLNLVQAPTLAVIGSDVDGVKFSGFAYLLLKDATFK